MDVIEIKPANVKALQAIRAQVEQLSAQYQGQIAALAIANDVPPSWQWDGENMRFVSPPLVPTPNGNGNGAAHMEGEDTRIARRMSSRYLLHLAAFLVLVALVAVFWFYRAGAAMLGQSPTVPVGGGSLFHCTVTAKTNGGFLQNCDPQGYSLETPPPMVTIVPMETPAAGSMATRVASIHTGHWAELVRDLCIEIY